LFLFLLNQALLFEAHNDTSPEKRVSMSRAIYLKPIRNSQASSSLIKRLSLRIINEKRRKKVISYARTNQRRTLESNSRKRNLDRQRNVDRQQNVYRHIALNQSAASMTLQKPQQSFSYFCSSDDSCKVLDENVRILSNLYQGYSNWKRWIRFSNHLFVKVLRPGDRKGTFSVFESSCHLLLPV